MPFFSAAINNALTRDQLIFTPWSVAIMGAILLVYIGWRIFDKYRTHRR